MGRGNEPREVIIPGLNNDVSLLCLAKLPYACLGACRNVSKTWKKAVNSIALRRIRLHHRSVQKLLCLCHGTSSVDNQPALLFSLFDPRALSTQPMPPLFLHRFFSSVVNFTEYEVVASGSVIFVIGGTFLFPDSSRVVNKQIWGFDTVAFAWRYYFQAPVGMHRFSAVSIGSKIFMSGSFLHSSTYILDVDTARFESAAELPEETESTFFPSTAMRFEDQIIMIPQAPSVFGHRSAFFYDVNHNTWTKREGFWPQNGSLNCCQAMGVLRGKLYGIKGGKGFAQDLISTRVILRKGDSWIQVAQLPSPKFSSENVSNTCHHFMSVVDDKLYIVEVVNERGSEKRSFSYLHILDIVDKGKFLIPRLEVFNKCISRRGVRFCTVVEV